MVGSSRLGPGGGLWALEEALEERVHRAIDLYMSFFITEEAAW